MRVIRRDSKQHGVCSFLLLLFLPLFLCSAVDPWKELDKGLWLGEFDSPQKSPAGDSKVIVLKIDPAVHQFKLLCRSETNDPPMPLSLWAKKYTCVAAVNAAMFQTDSSRSIGYMKNFEHVNNGHIRKDHKSFFAFNPTDKKLPSARMIDMECENIDQLKKKYNTMFQSIRMISCNGKNVWSRQQKRNSMSALGTDKGGKVLFIFSRSPYTTYDFINIVKKLPIGIERMMYLEGGSPACFYLSCNETHIEECGLTGLDRGFSPLLPNVLGIVKQ